MRDKMSEKTIEIEKSELEAIQELGRAASQVISELDREDVLYKEEPQDDGKK